jgi:hypothetical protein
MPREPLPLTREGGFRQAEKMFVLAFEGNITEPYYFRSLRSSDIFNDSGLIEIFPISRPKNAGNGDPLSVKKLLKQAKKNYKFLKSDEFWLIIDRDHWEEMHHHNFDLLYDDCEKEGNFFIALSNPCFEIWVLLHFKQICNFSDEEAKLIFENKFSDQKLNLICKNCSRAVYSNEKKINTLQSSIKNIGKANLVKQLIKGNVNKI